MMKWKNILLQKKGYTIENITPVIIVSIDHNMYASGQSSSTWIELTSPEWFEDETSPAFTLSGRTVDITDRRPLRKLFKAHESYIDDDLMVYKGTVGVTLSTLTIPLLDFGGTGTLYSGI